jgi:DNA-binding transcriptional MocR family regulator
MRLSYCHPTPERIRKGVEALGNVIKEEISRRGGGDSAKALKS